MEWDDGNAASTYIYMVAFATRQLPLHAFERACRRAQVDEELCLPGRKMRALVHACVPALLSMVIVRL
eukprot:357773-Chlamydomonas_euryale.AAC.11